MYIKESKKEIFTTAVYLLQRIAVKYCLFTFCFEELDVVKTCLSFKSKNNVLLTDLLLCFYTITGMN